MNLKSDLARLCVQLRDMIDPDDANIWPQRQLQALSEAGGDRWGMAEEFSGDGSDSRAMLDVYRLLGSASVLTAFILTQRNAACQRIETSPNRVAATRLLPRMCRSELFTTVGISHLTTSRQHVRTPAVRAEDIGSGAYRMTGSVPWASGARQAQVLVTGGTLDDGRQIVVAIPTDRVGIKVGEPIRLLGLSSSQTSVVELQEVEVELEDVLHGPVERVMSAGAGGGTGSLVTSAVAIGAAQRSLQGLATEVKRRPELAEFLAPLAHETDGLARELTAVSTSLSAEAMRQKANSLAIRTAQAWLAATKGAGFVSGHPAERAVRESMFFLVWSCPQTVLEGNLRELTCSAAAPL